jgi:hypothetical protein
VLTRDIRGSIVFGGKTRVLQVSEQEHMDASCLAELPVAALPGPIDDAIITSSMREEETRLQKETAMTSAAEREQVPAGSL